MNKTDIQSTHDLLRLSLMLIQNLELLVLQSIGISIEEDTNDLDDPAFFLKTLQGRKSQEKIQSPRSEVYQSLAKFQSTVLEVYKIEDEVQADSDEVDTRQYQNFLTKLIRICKAAIDGHIFSHANTIIQCRTELKTARALITKSSRYTSYVNSLSKEILFFLDTL